MATLSSSSYVRKMQPRTSSLVRQRNRYEPSDTEAEWEESPWKETDENSDQFSPIQVQSRTNISGSRFEGKSSIPAISSRRQQNSSALGLQRNDDGSVHSPPVRNRHLSARPVSPFSKSEQRRNTSLRTEMDDGFAKHHLSARPVSPHSKSEHRRNVSHKSGTDKVGEKVSYRRAASAPRRTFKERDVIKNETLPVGRTASRKEKVGHHKRSPTGGEINEILANVIISKAPVSQAADLESTDSIVPGDIFFSTDYDASAKRRNFFAANGGTEKPNTGSGKRAQMGSVLKQDNREVSATISSASTTQTNTASTKYTVSRQSSNLSDFSGRTNGTAARFTMNRRKSQSDAWFSCIKRGSCGGTKSPEKERAASYEATVIEKAFVVESLRQFWADKHQPSSLTSFTCHKQQALLLKHLAADEIPHVLFKGPPGSGKKSLTMALLREIYGDIASKISHDLRYFHIQEPTSTEVVVPISSSSHHVELNVSSEQNAMYALMSLVKQISADYAAIREISRIDAKADYKVMVLFDVDKAPSNIQHLIKWIMDCYSDACKLILCCEYDVDILESVKSRCKVIDVEALDIHEIREVLIQIAGKEKFELSMSFATRVANKSKGNLRRAIMALEACKANNYPFVDDQPIPVGWEEVLVDLAAGILADPSTNRLFLVRGKIQTLLVDHVNPKLILLKLVEQLLKGVAVSSRREVYYWHAYYDKKLPPGTSASLKLEEFTAKFMSIHRRNLNHH